MKTMAAIAVLALVLQALMQPVYAQEDLKSLVERHPLEIPPEPPVAYQNYMNLTGEELSCITLSVAVYLGAASITRTITLDTGDEVIILDSESDAYLTISGYNINASSPRELGKLAKALYTLSALLATGDNDAAEDYLAYTVYRMFSDGVEAIGDAVKLSSIKGSPQSMGLALLALTPIAACMDDDPPEGADVIDLEEASGIVERLMNMTDNMTSREALLDLSVAATFYLSDMLSRGSNYTIYKGDEEQGRDTSLLYIYRITNTSPGLARIASLIPEVFPTRLHLIPSILLAQRVGEDRWILPLPGEEAFKYYDSVDKLGKIAEVFKTVMSRTVTVNVTTTREKPDINLSNVDSVNLEQELRDILKEKRFKEFNPPSIEENPGQAGEVEISSDIVDIAKARLGDFKTLLKEIGGVRERINLTGLSGQGFSINRPGSVEPPSIGLPRIDPAILLVPALVFMAYMGREAIHVAGSYIRGRVRRIRGSMGEAVDCYNAALKASEKYGLVKRPEETPREFLERASGLPSWLREGLEAATRAYEHYRYGSMEPSREDLDACWRSVRRSIMPWSSPRRR